MDADIGKAFKEFAKWLRQTHEFPIRVPVYLSNKVYIKGKDGELKSSIFFAPFDANVEPYISIATGDYHEMMKEVGKENAMFSLLYSLALGVVRYQKWLDDNSTVDLYDPESDARELLCNYIDFLKIK